MKDDLTLVGATSDHQHWCGPTAISVVTGVPVTVVEHVFANYRNQDPERTRKVTERGVRGVHFHEMRYVLNNLGFKIIDVPLRPSWKSFGQWLKARSGEARRHTYIVTAKNHFLVVRGLEIYCSMQKHTTEARTRYKRAKLQRLWRIEKQI
jgi:predicted phosphoadenosine phosphosulfate sulfurtransferase